MRSADETQTDEGRAFVDAVRECLGLCPLYAVERASSYVREVAWSSGCERARDEREEYDSAISRRLDQFRDRAGIR